jgi:hypothetical protein
MGTEEAAPVHAAYRQNVVEGVHPARDQLPAVHDNADVYTRVVQALSRPIKVPLLLFKSTSILLNNCLHTRVQRIGWQEWDQVYFNAGDDIYRPATTQGSEDDTSTDWWNTDPNADFDPSSASSLPLDVWLPTQIHDTGSMSLGAFYSEHKLIIW